MCPQGMARLCWRCRRPMWRQLHDTTRSRTLALNRLGIRRENSPLCHRPASSAVLDGLKHNTVRVCVLRVRPPLPSTTTSCRTHPMVRHHMYINATMPRFRLIQIDRSLVHVACVVHPTVPHHIKTHCTPTLQCHATVRCRLRRLTLRDGRRLRTRVIPNSAPRRHRRVASLGRQLLLATYDEQCSAHTTSR